MNQQKTEAFLAARRKELDLTQQELEKRRLPPLTSFLKSDTVDSPVFFEKREFL